MQKCLQSLAENSFLEVSLLKSNSLGCLQESLSDSELESGKTQELFLLSWRSLDVLSVRLHSGFSLSLCLRPVGGGEYPCVVE